MVLVCCREEEMNARRSFQPKVNLKEEQQKQTESQKARTGCHNHGDTQQSEYESFVCLC